jgi:putative peptidoglycan lipid II flippase
MPQPRNARQFEILPRETAMVVLGTRTRQGEAVLEFTQRSDMQEREEYQAQESGITRAALSVGIAVSISRILGLVREMVLARYFGAGLHTDAFNVAYRIPNLLRDLFAEGALSSAFIPTFIRRLTRNGKEEAWLLASRVINVLLVIVGALTLVFFFGAKLFVYLLASGYASIPQKFELTVQMTRIMSPFLLCISLAAVGMGLLNACGRFFVPAMASSAFNICCILAGIFLSPLMSYWGLQPIVSMAIGALVGGVSQFLVMIPSAYAAGFRYRFVLGFSDPGLRGIARLMLPAVIGLSAMQINIVVDSQIASVFGNGPVSWLNYGFRLIQFPIGVFGIAIATSTMTAVSRYAALNAKDKLFQAVDSSLKLAACLTFPATIGLIIFRREIVQLLYEGGLFLPEHTLKTSQVVLLYALGLFSYAAVKILVPVFYALDDARTPVRISLVSVAAKIALNFAFIIPLGYLGLPLATSMASWLNLGLLLRHLPRRAGEIAAAGDAKSYIRIAMAAIMMGALALLVFHGTGLLFPESGGLGQQFRLGLSILVGFASLFPLFRLFRVDEAKEMYRIACLLVRKTR